MRNCTLFFFAFFILYTNQTLEAQEFSVSCNPIIYKQYTEWTKKFSQPDFSLLKIPNIHRGVIELYILSCALEKGGMNPKIVLSVVPNYTRGLFEAKNGRVTMPAETIWKSEADNSLFLSDPVLENGSIELGVFTLPTNQKMNKVQTLDHLRSFSAVSSNNWVVNWDTLKAMGVEGHSVTKQESMFKFIGAGRADFMLQEFSTEEDLGIEIAGVRLVPVKNIKVGLMGSRHFAISRKAYNSKKLYEALQIGLKKMRAGGLISAAYEEAGFFNPRVKNWTKIFPK